MLICLFCHNQLSSSSLSQNSQKSWLKYKTIYINTDIFIFVFLLFILDRQTLRFMMFNKRIFSYMSIYSFS